MIIVVAQCIGIKLLTINKVVQCIRIALLMISRILNCAMHYDCIAYDKHTGAVLWGWYC